MSTRRRGLALLVVAALSLAGLVSPSVTSATGAPAPAAITPVATTTATTTAVAGPAGGTHGTHGARSADTLAPLPVSGLEVTATTFRSVTLTWGEPTNADVTGVVVRRRTGTTAPHTLDEGVLVTHGPRRTTTVTDPGLQPGTTYSYAVFTRDGAGNVSTPATVTAMTLTHDGATGMSGRITDEKGRPVAGAVVFVGTADAGGPTVVTGADGRWAVTGLVPGSWYACFGVDETPAWPTGLKSECWDDADPGFESRPPNPTWIAVAAGRITPRIDAVLSPGAALTGRVLDADGSPVAGVGVVVYGPRANAYVETDANGRYRFTGFEAQSVRLCFTPGVATRGSSPTGYLRSCPTRGVSIQLGRTVNVAPLTLPHGGAVRGRVTDSSGAPLAGVQVMATSPTAGNWPGVTDTTGRYVVTGLAPDAYTVCFDGTMLTSAAAPAAYVPQCQGGSPYDPYGPGTVPVTADRFQTVGARLPVAAGISARITGPGGQPLEGISVIVRDNPTPDSQWFLSTDSSGRVTVPGIVPGDHVVCFRPPYESDYLEQCVDGVTDESAATPVSLPAGVLTPLAARLVRGSSVTGVVTDASGLPVEGVSVSVRPADFSDPRPGGYATTDAEGRYTAPGLSPDDYVISFDPGFAVGGPPTGYAPRSYRGGSPVTLRAGQTLTASVALATGAAVTGVLTGPDGEPLAGVNVYVRTADYAYQGQGATDETGRYTVSALAAGSYAVCFYPDPTLPGGSTIVGECFRDQPLDGDTPTPVRLRAGVTSTADAQLARSGAMTGQVTDARGQGVAYATVQVWDDMGFYVAAVSTDENGVWTVGGLAGTFTVCFDATYSPSAGPGGLIAECWDDQPSTSPTPVNVVVGQTTSGIDASLADGAAVSGHVTDSSGAPVAYANVDVYSVDSGQPAPGYGSTDENGAYVRGGLAPGTVTVCFSAFLPEGYASGCYGGSDPATATPVDLTAGEVAAGLDAVLTVPTAG